MMLQSDFSIRYLMRFFVVLAVCFASNAMAETSMPSVLDEHNIKQCRPQMLSLAEGVIGKKEHRLHLEQPKRNADKYPFSVTGIIAYHDQDAQIQFYANPLDNGACEVSYIESFALPETCLAVREQVFKKWKFIGKLSKDSFFLRHKKDLTKNATLSSINKGASCLVTRRDSGI